MVDLTVRLLRGGPLHLLGLSADASIDHVKEVLHESYSSKTAIPLPDKQRLVYKDRVLSQGTLASAGVTSGATLVMLAAAEPPTPLQEEHVPVPTSVSITAAIMAEARRRGIEGQMQEDPTPPPAGRNAMELALPHDLAGMDHRLQQLIAALEGRLGALRQAGVQLPPNTRVSAGRPANYHGNISSVAARAGPTAAAGSAAALEGQRDAATAVAAAPEEPEELVVPEPSADGLQQLTEMGFSDALARKALVLCRNQLDAATEWLLVHGEDAGAADPPTQEQLRQVYGRGSRGHRHHHRGPSAASMAPRGASLGDMVAQIVDMGFTEQQAAAALGRYPSVEVALAWLLRPTSADEVAAAAGPPPPAAAAAASAAAPPSGDGAAAAASASGTVPMDMEPSVGASHPATAAVSAGHVAVAGSGEMAAGRGARATTLAATGLSSGGLVSHPLAVDVAATLRGDMVAGPQDDAGWQADAVSPAMVQQLLEDMMAAFGGEVEGPEGMELEGDEDGEEGGGDGMAALMHHMTDTDPFGGAGGGADAPRH